MTTETPIRLDEVTGVITYFGYGTQASIRVIRTGGLSLADARETLYYAVLDGRARVPDALAIKLDLCGPTPRIRRPGSTTSRTTHLKCPKCRARSSRDGFHPRGQFCLCGWRRAEEAGL